MSLGACRLCGEAPLGCHGGADDVESLSGESDDSYHSCAVVRDPWGQIVRHLLGVLRLRRRFASAGQLLRRYAQLRLPGKRGR